MCGCLLTPVNVSVFLWTLGPLKGDIVGLQLNSILPSRWKTFSMKKWYGGMAERKQAI